MNRSIDFFEQQFRRQAAERPQPLNPFEAAALPHLSGELLDLGCGLGNLALAAAARGCRVTALDGSPTAIAQLRDRAAASGLAVEARQADLAAYRIDRDYDSIACIGLLMFFDCDSARRLLAEIRARVRPGGVAALNVLVEGTSYREMFDGDSYCLFGPDELQAAFAGWQLLHEARDDFPAPGGTRKRFATLVACRPSA